MVEKVGGILRVLHEALHSVLREELAIRLGYPPKDFRVELPRGRRCEEVHLAVEGIEYLVQTGGYIPSSGSFVQRESRCYEKLLERK